MAIYQGETITIKATFKDDDGALITNLGDYTITVLVYNQTFPSNEVSFGSSDITTSISDATATITISPTVSANFYGSVIIEIRMVDNDGAKIGQAKQAFTVLSTKIKNY